MSLFPEFPHEIYDAESRNNNPTQITGNITTTATVTLVNDLSRGVGYTQRRGNYVVIDQIEMRSTIISDTTSATNRWKLALVWDKFPNGAAPPYTDIWNSTEPTCFPNPDYSDRFDILWQAVDSFSGTNAAGLINPSYHVCLKGLNLLTVYNSSGLATIAAINNGALFFTTVGTTAAGTADCSHVTNVEFYFSDAMCPPQRP